MGANLKIAGALALLLAAPANAAIVTGAITGGDSLTGGAAFIKIDPIPLGFSVGNDDFQDLNVRGFDELQNKLLASTLMVNVGTNVAGGTRVASHYVVFDPRSSQTSVGTVTFGRNILGIITTSASLGASDFLGNPLVTYQLPLARGLESITDSVSFFGKTATFSLKSSKPGDSFRVITAAVPEPTSWVMLIAGFGFIGLASRRRRNRAVVAA